MKRIGIEQLISHSKYLSVCHQDQQAGFPEAHHYNALESFVYSQNLLWTSTDTEIEIHVIPLAGLVNSRHRTSASCASKNATWVIDRRSWTLPTVKPAVKPTTHCN